MAKWVCPGCRKSFEIPEGWESPKFCAECRELAKGGPPKAPVPPKPIPQIVLVDESGAETPAKERRLPVAIVVRVAAVIVIYLAWLFCFPKPDEGDSVRRLEESLKRSEDFTNEQIRVREEKRMVDEFRIYPDTDYSRIQGVWERTDLPSSQLVFRGRSLSSRIKSVPDGRVIDGYSCDFELDETKSPKHFTSNGEMSYGIYRIDGDAMTIAFASGLDQSLRPSKFLGGNATNFKQLCWNFRRVQK